jgi:hypothetical protein
MPHLNRPVYESLPGAYGVLGAALLWLSYRHREAWWSTACALAGLAGLVAGLMIWMRRRDYRALASDYRNRGGPVADREHRQD